LEDLNLSFFGNFSPPKRVYVRFLGQFFGGRSDNLISNTVLNIIGSNHDPNQRIEPLNFLGPASCENCSRWDYALLVEVCNGLPQ